MTRRTKGWATTGILGLGVVMIVGGVLIAGGPGQGRAEQRDERRERDLSLLQSHLECLSRETGAMVVEPAATAACPLPEQLVDPVSGAPYRIERIDDENLRLCADFETDHARERLRLYDYPTTDIPDEQGCRVAHFPKDQYQPGG